MSLAVVVRDNLISSREPKHDTVHGLLVTGKGIVEIETQGQVGEQVAVFVDLLSGEEKGQYIVVVLPKPSKREGKE